MTDSEPQTTSPEYVRVFYSLQILVNLNVSHVVRQLTWYSSDADSEKTDSFLVLRLSARIRMDFKIDGPTVYTYPQKRPVNLHRPRPRGTWSPTATNLTCSNLSELWWATQNPNHIRLCLPHEIYNLYTGSEINRKRERHSFVRFRNKRFVRKHIVIFTLIEWNGTEIPRRLQSLIIIFTNIVWQVSSPSRGCSVSLYFFPDITESQLIVIDGQFRYLEVSFFLDRSLWQSNYELRSPGCDNLLFLTVFIVARATGQHYSQSRHPSV